MDNYNAWLQGIYNHKAIVAAFSDKAKYPDKPIENKSEENQALNAEERFSAWVTVANKEFEKKNSTP